MKDFEEGFDYFVKNNAVFNSAEEMNNFVVDRFMYVDSVQTEIDKLNDGINAFKGNAKDIGKLKGDVAEFYHAGTFNIDAAMNRSSSRVEVPRSNALGSEDIVGVAGSVKGKSYSLKYYSDGEHSAIQQAKSVLERYKEYKSSGGKLTQEEYLEKHGLAFDEQVLSKPLYEGQGRLIPADQIPDAIQKLKLKIEKEKLIRPQEVERYQETLDKLTATVTDDEGNSSYELTEEDSRVLAKVAKVGEYDASDEGIVAPDKMNVELLTKESLKAGMDAAILSFVIKLAPEIVKSINYLIETGEIDKEELKKSGGKVLDGTAYSFVSGSLTAAITYAMKNGSLGEQLIEVNPQAVGPVVVLAINTLKTSLDVALGKKTSKDLAMQVIKDTYIITTSKICGCLGATLLHKWPTLGYTLGNLVGSVAGALTYEYGYQKAISFCEESGVTLFGLVEQDYTLPDEVIKEMGIDTFELETFEVETFEVETFDVKTFDIETFDVKGVEFRYLRRGVIGFNKIGYI